MRYLVLGLVLAGCGGNHALPVPLTGEWSGSYMRAGDGKTGTCRVLVSEDGSGVWTVDGVTFRGRCDSKNDWTGQVSGWSYPLRGQMIFGVTIGPDTISGALKPLLGSSRR